MQRARGFEAPAGLPPHAATVAQSKSALGARPARAELPPHPATVVQAKVAFGSKAVLAPHPATIQAKQAVGRAGTLPPHPATVAQAKPAFGSGVARRAELPPHPATIGRHGSRASAQRMQAPRSAYIATIGPEIVSHGPTVLADEVKALKGRYATHTTVSFADAERGEFPPADAEDVIYLVAHGEDPGLEAVKTPQMGEKNGAAIAAILRKILRNFGKKDQVFRGAVVLEGCHTGVRLYRGSQVTGSSLLDDVQAAVNEEKFFKTALDSTVTVAGYLGSNFTDRNGSIYNSATIESPPERVLHNRIYRDNVVRDGNTRVTGEEAVVERRWRAK